MFLLKSNNVFWLEAYSILVGSHRLENWWLMLQVFSFLGDSSNKVLSLKVRNSLSLSSEEGL